MKRNNLILIAGILMILGAVACLVASVFSGIYLADFITAMAEEITIDSEVSFDFLYLTYLLTLVMMIIVYFVEGAMFITFGILLIVKYSKNVSMEQYRSLVVIAQIVGYVSVFVSMGSDMVAITISIALLLTSSILLSVALSKHNKSKENNVDFNVNPKTAGGKQSTNMSNMADDERAYTNELMIKVKAIKELRDNGTITEEEYTKMIYQVLGVDERSGERRKE